jgi:hypothetical protein
MCCRRRRTWSLGDATYDFKDYLQIGVTSQAPPLMVKTSFLWTVSDPTLAAVNGEASCPKLSTGGVQLLSYIGHGGIRLWASENLLNI